MSNDEVVEFLKTHLQAIQDNDTQAYNETAAEDLTLYEWWVTPHRIDGLPFHEFMMVSNAERGMVFGAEGKAKSPTRFDLSNLRVQRYGDTAIASYTLLISTAAPEGVKVAAHNESRVMVKLGGAWKVVHVHKSPAWQAPHIQP
ncbi:MAG: nuclear transport factor 2 family protein [Anaerolineales bacterium]|nr:nuclear transport factor 2 family protein [Anaerolineales bacterium]NUQ83643.1 nuclear transport factor 2 family protein [Anaerolineales bacterium]